MVEKKKRLSTVPLMLAFRDAKESRDATQESGVDADEQRVLSKRGGQRVSNISEADLRKQLSRDLADLVNTISLNSTIDLSEFEYVKGSILNFGIDDIGHLTSEEMGVEQIADDLCKSLKRFEPRFVPASVNVSKVPGSDDVNQRVMFNIEAELHSKPYNLDLEFLAEVDVLSGKIQFSRLARSK